MLSRKSSINKGASSGFHESVFNSNSAQSSSRSSIGRRGPLDTFARAAMNAVKAVKACWRCKVLRKLVSDAAVKFCHVPGLNKFSVI
jgi:hypothetical protein